MSERKKKKIEDREKVTEEEWKKMMRIAATPWLIAEDEEAALKRFEKKVWEVANNETYKEATKTNEWWMAKNILFTREKEKSHGMVFCWWCGKQLSFHSCVMHHTDYTPLFCLENIEFVCHDCHKAIHNK